MKLPGAIRGKYCYFRFNNVSTYNKIPTKVICMTKNLSRFDKKLNRFEKDLITEQMYFNMRVHA